MSTSSCIDFLLLNVTLCDLCSCRYLFTVQEGEAKFGPDPEEFRPSHRALAKKAKREAAAAAAAQAAAAALRQEELGGVVDERKPKKPKQSGGGEQAAAETKGRESAKWHVAVQHDGEDGDTEDALAVSLKKNTKVKEKSGVESCAAARTYPDSAGWGDQGLVLDGRIAAAIHDMVRGLTAASSACMIPLSTALFFCNICRLFQGFASPLPIQSAVIPRATRDRLDIFGCAETGSGKTLAYAVPVMQRALAEAGNAGWDGEAPLTCAFAIIVVPTRELGVQVYNVCR